MDTPIRRLDGITYWVIEDPEGIYDFINTEIRKEWTEDVRSEHRNPNDDPWLENLPKRRWNLEIAETEQIKLNPRIVNYVDERKGYVFLNSLNQRRRGLERAVRDFGAVIWPLIVGKEDLELVDGYCRYATLKAMNVKHVFIYAGSL
jgi:hypothetical protein